MTERSLLHAFGTLAPAPARIDIAALLGEDPPHYPIHLVTRPTGRSVRRRISEIVDRLQPPRVSVLDFRGARVVDLSCADEVAAKLMVRYRPGNGQDPAFFLLRVADALQRHAIHSVLNRRGLAAVCRGAGRGRLLGRLDSEERRAFELLEGEGTITDQDAPSLIGPGGARLLRRLCLRGIAFPAGGGAVALSSVTARPEKSTRKFNGGIQ